MMTININIKAKVDSLTLSEIYDLLSIYSKTREPIIFFKSHKFKIEATTDMAIHYIITEVE